MSFHEAGSWKLEAGCQQTRRRSGFMYVIGGWKCFERQDGVSYTSFTLDCKVHLFVTQNYDTGFESFQSRQRTRSDHRLAIKRLDTGRRAGFVSFAIGDLPGSIPHLRRAVRLLTCDTRTGEQTKDD